MVFILKNYYQLLSNAAYKGLQLKYPIEKIYFFLTINSDKDQINIYPDFKVTAPYWELNKF